MSFYEKSTEKKLKRNDFQHADSGFAVFAALVVLLFVSVLPCGLCVLEKLKLQNFEKRKQNFYSQIEDKNKEIEQKWGKIKAEENEID